MKANLLIPLLAILVLGSASPGQDTGSDSEADHQALRALKDKATKAINEMDFETLATCLPEEFAFTTVDQSIIRSNQELKAYYDDILSGARYEYPLESMHVEPEADILTKFVNDTTGYCYGTCKSTYTLPGGTSVTVDSRWSALVTKQDGEWKIEMVHAGVNFLDNPVLAMKDQAASLKMTVAMVVAGVVILILLALLLKKKASSRP